MLRIFLLMAATVGLVLFAGGHFDPTPAESRIAHALATQFEVTQVGSSFDAAGCQVNVHRVTGGSAVPIKPFTLAVAKCPTATVTSTSQVCGKNCIRDDVTVMAAAPAEPARVTAQAEQLAQIQALSAKVAQLTDKIQQLNQIAADGTP